MKLYRTLLVFVCILVISCKETKKVDKTEIIKKREPVELTNNTSKISSNEVDTSNMVHFEGGTIKIGSETGAKNEAPVFEMKIAPFYLDKYLVTVAEFREFVLKTNYVTEADKFGDSGVYSFEQGNWSLMPGANWEYPLGKDKPKSLDNHPVTHVSWNDANAYASWKGKRLPTEFEWEFAAKNGENTTNKYAWGNKPVINGKYMANVWQGSNIQESEPKDGYLLTSPIGAFGATKSGLYDMGGNVWQWCENYYKPYPYNDKSAPQDPNIRATRGGSFMYDEALENSYTTTFRSQNSIDTSLFNMGFRCAK